MSFEIPRQPVPARRLFFKMGGWVVLVLGVILVIVTLIGQHSLTMAKRFESEGLRATAMVVEKYTTVSTDSDGDKTTTYWLTLEYITNERQDISLHRTASSSEYRRAEVGGEYELLYLESEPERTELTAGSHRRSARVSQIIMWVVGAIWLFSLWLIGGWTVSAMRARRYGQREEAKVTEIKRTGVKVNNKPRYRLVWRASDGSTGQSLLHRIDHFDRIRVGDPAPIYHGLKRSWWVGDVGERPEFARSE